MIKIAKAQKAFSDYRFIDLFAGIGGFHYALESFGAKCVFASEIDKQAAKIYETNHKLLPKGDITQISEKEIPSHDILCAGFPCQAFSISGKQNGFQDHRGSIFFEIARILQFHQPRLLLLENVKNLISHDKGKTLQTITSTLEKLNYQLFYKILNTSHFGLPQNRERVFIVGFNRNYFEDINFTFPNIQIDSSLLNILEDKPLDAKIIQRTDIQIYKNYEYTANTHLPNRPIQIGKVNKGGQGERIYHPHGHAITLSAQGGGIGARTGLYKIQNAIRKLSSRECARLQGFPESFILAPSTAQAQKQFGNSVSIDVVQYILMEMAKCISYQSSAVSESVTKINNFVEREV